MARFIPLHQLQNCFRRSDFLDDLSSIHCWYVPEERLRDKGNGVKHTRAPHIFSNNIVFPEFLVAEVKTMFRSHKVHY